MKMRFVFFYFCCILLPLSCCATTSNGPYKVILLKAEPCKHPPKPYEENPGIIFYSEIYNSSKKQMLKGNLTVVKVNPYMRVSSKGLVLEDGKWKATHVLNSVGCQGVLYKVFKIVLKVSNNKGCVPKGTYIFNDVDFNAMMQRWTKTYFYGKFLWRMAIGTSTATTVCWEFDSINVPKSSSE